jgi:TetR/AcrR family transcriptional regulator, transcriptional repressor for nem operon
LSSGLFIVCYKKESSLARALEFDYAGALERATQTFWRTGYANTSLRDLLKAMGIGEGSFYNTMKSKKNAYLECLKHYDATVSLRRVQAFASAPTAALGVRALFQTIFECLDDPAAPRVCLMAGALTPDVLAETELRTYIEDQVSSWTEQMVSRFEADKERGILPKSFDPQAVVHIIVTYIQGLWRVALVSYDRRKLQIQVDTFLTSLGL